MGLEGCYLPVYSQFVQYDVAFAYIKLYSHQIIAYGVH